MVSEHMRKLHKLQVLRAIAALLVVADHSLTVIAGHGLDPKTATAFSWYLGEQGVAIFFVISGFIMVRSNWSAFARPGAAVEFALRRVLRIAPIYWLDAVMAPSRA